MVPWKKLPHEGKTPSTILWYTSAEDTSSSDEEDWELGYLECYEVEEEGLDDAAENDYQLTMRLGRSKVRHTEGVVDPSNSQDVELRPQKTIKVSSQVVGIELENSTKIPPTL